MRPSGPASTAGIPGQGEVFAGAYRVERVLGRGAMGMVVAAEHLSLRRRVAVKFLLPRVMRMSWASARFLREARAAAAIRSEHVAKVIDAGVSESGLPYIVMEHLAGSDIQAVLDARGPLPIKEAVGYLLQASEAIAKAHSLGIVHRDLKPGNLFLAADADGVALVKVLDFGLSKALDADAAMQDGKITSAGVMLGSPCYMSPEQVRSAKDVDERTDLWSLGVILYQLLTTRFPFEAPSVSALFAAIAADPPTPPRAYRPDLPADLEAVILRCLEKDVKRRVQSVAELARALAPFAARGSRKALARIGRIARRRGAPPTPSRRPSWRRSEVDPQAATVPGAQAERSPRRAACPDDGPTLVSRGVTPHRAAARPPPPLRDDDGPTLVSGEPMGAPRATSPPPRGGEGARPSRCSPLPRSGGAPPRKSGPQTKKSGPAAITSTVARRRRGAAALIAVAVALITASALAATLWPRGAPPAHVPASPGIAAAERAATPDAPRAAHAPAPPATTGAPASTAPSLPPPSSPTQKARLARRPERADTTRATPKEDPHPPEAPPGEIIDAR